MNKLFDLFGKWLVGEPALNAHYAAGYAGDEKWIYRHSKKHLVLARILGTCTDECCCECDSYPCRRV